MCGFLLGHLRLVFVRLHPVSVTGLLLKIAFEIKAAHIHVPKYGVRDKVRVQPVFLRKLVDVIGSLLLSCRLFVFLGRVVHRLGLGHHRVPRRVMEKDVT